MGCCIRCYIRVSLSKKKTGQRLRLFGIMVCRLENLGQPVPSLSTINTIEKRPWAVLETNHHWWHTKDPEVAAQHEGQQDDTQAGADPYDGTENIQ